MLLTPKIHSDVKFRHQILGNQHLDRQCPLKMQTTYTEAGRYFSISKKQFQMAAMSGNCNLLFMLLH